MLLIFLHVKVIIISNRLAKSIKDSTNAKVNGRLTVVQQRYIFGSIPGTGREPEQLDSVKVSLLDGLVDFNGPRVLVSRNFVNPNIRDNFPLA